MYRKWEYRRMVWDFSVRLNYWVTPVIQVAFNGMEFYDKKSILKPLHVTFAVLCFTASVWFPFKVVPVKEKNNAKDIKVKEN